MHHLPWDGLKGLGELLQHPPAAATQTQAPHSPWALCVMARGGDTAAREQEVYPQQGKMKDFLLKPGELS